MVRRLAEYASLLLMIAAAVIAGVVFYFLPLTSFEPVNYYSVETAKAELCPTEDAGTLVDFEIDPNRYDAIKEIEIETNWIAVDVEGITPGTERSGGTATLSASSLSPGRTTGKGNFLRITPNDPGVWRMENKYTVRSDRPVLPPTQTIELAAENTTTILEPSNEQCSLERR